MAVLSSSRLDAFRESTSGSRDDQAVRSMRIDRQHAGIAAMAVLA
jgi:hypothetical protein